MNRTRFLFEINEEVVSCVSLFWSEDAACGSELLFEGYDKEGIAHYIRHEDLMKKTEDFGWLYGNRPKDYLWLHMALVCYVLDRLTPYHALQIQGAPLPSQYRLGRQIENDQPHGDFQDQRIEANQLKPHPEPNLFPLLDENVLTK